MNETLTAPELIATKAKSNKKVIEIEKLKKSFGTQEVLKNISLKLYEGENLVILGKSGSGKSVLIKCIVGLLTPDAGNITVLDQDMNHITYQDLGLIRKKIGFLFQSGALFDSMTVRQNLEFPLRSLAKKIPAEVIDKKVKEVLDNVGLYEAIDKVPSQLSGGMRKRVSLARTIVVDPIIMLYDEPTTGLDPVTSSEISALINQVQKKYKTSSLIITHDIACVRATANRVILINEGEVYMEGKLEAFENSDDPFIKSFFN